MNQIANQSVKKSHRTVPVNRSLTPSESENDSDSKSEEEESETINKKQSSKQNKKTTKTKKNKTITQTTVTFSNSSLHDSSKPTTSSYASVLVNINQNLINDLISRSEVNDFQQSIFTYDKIIRKHSPALNWFLSQRDFKTKPSKAISFKCIICDKEFKEKISKLEF